MGVMTRARQGWTLGVITETKAVKGSEAFGITVDAAGDPWYTMMAANKIAELQLRCGGRLTCTVPRTRITLGTAGRSDRWSSLRSPSQPDRRHDNGGQDGVKIVELFGHVGSRPLQRPGEYVRA